MSRHNSDRGRLAVTWLATAFVVVIGAAASAFVIIAATDQREQPLLVWGASFAGLSFILFLMNLRWDRPVGKLQTWLFAQHRSDPTDEYRAARRRIQSREKYGNNGPPTLETVRDAADFNGTWAPRSSGGSRSRREGK
ncbi:hypothetical protein [Schlesneria sp. T3-172]|uniref:hypothetical protein n=1 Tax=Schlesneria sphaerica TaxID=3373610 RepID=UPI0037CB6681